MTEVHLAASSSSSMPSQHASSPWPSKHRCDRCIAAEAIDTCLATLPRPSTSMQHASPPRPLKQASQHRHGRRRRRTCLSNRRCSPCCRASTLKAPKTSYLGVDARSTNNRPQSPIVESPLAARHRITDGRLNCSTTSSQYRRAPLWHDVSMTSQHRPTPLEHRHSNPAAALVASVCPLAAARHVAPHCSTVGLMAAACGERAAGLQMKRARRRRRSSGSRGRGQGGEGEIQGAASHRECGAATGKRDGEGVS